MFVSAPSLAAQSSGFCEEEQEGVLTVVGEAEEPTEVPSSIAEGGWGGAQRVPLDHIRMAQRKNAVNQDVVRRKSLR